MTKKKKISIFILLAVILVFMMFLSILSGSVYIKPHDVFNVLTGNDSSSVNALLIFNIRLPRMIAGYRRFRKPKSKNVRKICSV